MSHLALTWSKENHFFPAFFAIAKALHNDIEVISVLRREGFHHVIGFIAV
jgi:hypothetical protein